MFIIEDQSLMLSGGRRVTFPDFIAEAVAFDDEIVVRLENHGWKRTNENIFGVDLGGRVIWQIKPRFYAYGDSPYTNIHRNGEYVDCYNWDGTIASLDPRTGQLMREGMVGAPSTRQASVRRWM